MGVSELRAPPCRANKGINTRMSALEQSARPSPDTEFNSRGSQRGRHNTYVCEIIALVQKESAQHSVREGEDHEIQGPSRIHQYI